MPPLKAPQLADREGFRQLAASGRTQAEVAADLGVSAPLVGYWQRRHGIRWGDRPPLYPVRDRDWMALQILAGLNAVEIAREVGCDPQTVRLWQIRHGFRQPPEPRPMPRHHTADKIAAKGGDAWLIEQKRAGRTDRGIGDELGVPAGAVQQYRHRRGLHSGSARARRRV